MLRDARGKPTWATADSPHNPGRPAGIYHGHSSPVYAVSWSPNGHYLASAGYDTGVQVWEAQTLETVYTYTGHTQPIKTLAWSPDGASIASGGDDKIIHIWNPTTGQHQFPYTNHTAWIRTLAWSPTGDTLASASDETVHVWQRPG